jgi:tRNA threonylcarbamoyladenosine biosynthesis protein TsaE
MDTNALNFRLAVAADTERLGAALAAALPDAARCSVVIHLQGDLGAGKTTLVRGFLRARGVAGKVRSPTYTLVEPHIGPDHTYVHVDLYRLQGPGEIADLGLRDYLEPGHVVLIEWPERGGRAIPAPDLQLSLEYAGDGRALAARGAGALWTTWRRNLVSNASLLPYLSNLA